ncbi:MAG: hypothetical protein AABZ61_06245, partial [Bacteroidota bacterium]
MPIVITENFTFLGIRAVLTHWLSADDTDSNRWNVSVSIAFDGAFSLFILEHNSAMRAVFSVAVNLTVTIIAHPRLTHQQILTALGAECGPFHAL